MAPMKRSLLSEYFYYEKYAVEYVLNTVARMIDTIRKTIERIFD